MTVTVPGPAGTRSRGRRAAQAPRPDATSTVESAAPAQAPARTPATTPPATPRTTPATPRTARPRTAAAQRAYARRAQRDGRPVERVEEPVEATGGRARFVVLIIGLLVVGIAATLWLSTQAIADSYHLEQVRQQSTDLSERADRLQREVTKMDSPSALAERAKEMGMVFPGEAAMLVVRPDGTVTLVGEPKPAAKPAPPPPPADPAPPAAGQQLPDQSPGDDQQAPAQRPG